MIGLCTVSYCGSRLQIKLQEVLEKKTQGLEGLTSLEEKLTVDNLAIQQPNITQFKATYSKDINSEKKEQFRKIYTNCKVKESHRHFRYTL